MWRTFRALLLILLLAGGAYMYRDQVETFALQAYREVVPCAVPISYTVGTIDPRFGLATSTLLSAIETATATWEKAAGKTLFVHESAGGLTVNLVYDIRQETTQKLRELGLSVEQDMESYESVRARYLELVAEHERAESIFEARFAAYERDADAYANEVESWNARGGAPKGAYADLERRRIALEREERALRTELDAVNAKVGAINTLAKYLNALAHDLNITVAEYNTVGDAVEGEFEQAVYESRPGSHKIDVFEYDNLSRLTRVLTHEFGHALGLEHLEDEDAVMYRLNQSRVQELTEADIEALTLHCRL